MNGVLLGAVLALPVEAPGFDEAIVVSVLRLQIVLLERDQQKYLFALDNEALLPRPCAKLQAILCCRPAGEEHGRGEHQGQTDGRRCITDRDKEAQPVHVRDTEIAEQQQGHAADIA